MGLPNLRALVAEEAQGATRSFVSFAADIKLGHSVFALPFAMAAFVLGRLPLPDLRQALLLLACMVTARSFAMGMNRFLDRDVDRANPRTRARKIPSGELTATQGLFWSLAAAGLFTAGAFALSPLAGYCAVPLLAILMAYSLLKRLSWVTHWYLGACLGLAPVAVEIALTGAASGPVMLLGAGVTFWTAGFDILYSLQDLDFDRKTGLHSVPGRFGPAAALWISRASFALMIAALAGAGALGARGPVYFAGVALIAGILVYEHVLVRDARETGRSPRLNMAFFAANAWVSVLFFVFAAADWLLYH